MSSDLLERKFFINKEKLVAVVSKSVPNTSLVALSFVKKAADSMNASLQSIEKFKQQTKENYLKATWYNAITDLFFGIGSISRFTSNQDIKQCSHHVTWDDPSKSIQELCIACQIYQCNAKR
jgi:hypothetical protein